MYFTGDDGYQKFLVFTPVISTGILLKETKPFDTNLKPTMSNLANPRIILKFNNSVLVKKVFLNCIVISF